MEDDLKQTNWKTASKKEIKMEDHLKFFSFLMEDDLKKNQKNRRRPQSQLKKSTLIGCDIIVN